MPVRAAKSTEQPGQRMEAAPNGRDNLTRRQFVRGSAAIGLTATGAALLAGCSREAAVHPAGAEAPLETATIRLLAGTALCLAPQLVAEDLLRIEGFADVQTVSKATTAEQLAALTTGEADLSMMYAPSFITRMGADVPVVALAGGHVGCTELIGTRHVRTVRDLKGKRVGVGALGAPTHLFAAMR